MSKYDDASTTTTRMARGSAVSMALTMANASSSSRQPKSPRRRRRRRRRTRTRRSVPARINLRRRRRRRGREGQTREILKKPSNDRPVSRGRSRARAIAWYQAARSLVVHSASCCPARPRLPALPAPARSRPPCRRTRTRPAAAPLPASTGSKQAAAAWPACCSCLLCMHNLLAEAPRSPRRPDAAAHQRARARRRLDRVPPRGVYRPRRHRRPAGAAATGVDRAVRRPLRPRTVRTWRRRRRRPPRLEARVRQAGARRAAGVRRRADDVEGGVRRAAGRGVAAER